MTALTQHPEAILLLSRGHPLDSRSIFFCRFEISHRVHCLTGDGQTETSLSSLARDGRVAPGLDLHLNGCNSAHLHDAVYGSLFSPALPGTDSENLISVSGSSLGS